MQDSLRNKGKGREVREPTENTEESAPKRVRESRESVLSRSPLRGTSMQDETRMHVSVQRSTSSKENEAKVRRGKHMCGHEGEYKIQTKSTNN